MFVRYTNQLGQVVYGVSSGIPTEDGTLEVVDIDGSSDQIHVADATEIGEQEYVGVLQPGNHVKLDMQYYVQGPSRNTVRYAVILDKKWSEADQVYIFTTQHRDKKVFESAIDGKSVTRVTLEEFEETKRTRNREEEVESTSDDESPSLPSPESSLPSSRARTQVERFDPLGDVGYFNRAKEKVARDARPRYDVVRLKMRVEEKHDEKKGDEKKSKQVVRSESKEPKQPKEKEDTYDSVKLKLKGMENNIPFPQRLAAYVKSNHEENLRTLLLDELRRKIVTFDDMTLNVREKVLSKIREFTLRILRMEHEGERILYKSFVLAESSRSNAPEQETPTDEHNEEDGTGGAGSQDPQSPISWKGTFNVFLELLQNISGQLSKDIFVDGDEDWMSRAVKMNNVSFVEKLLSINIPKRHAVWLEKGVDILKLAADQESPSRQVIELLFDFKVVTKDDLLNPEVVVHFVSRPQMLIGFQYALQSIERLNGRTSLENVIKKSHVSSLDSIREGNVGMTKDAFLLLENKIPYFDSISPDFALEFCRAYLFSTIEGAHDVCDLMLAKDSVNTMVITNLLKECFDRKDESRFVYLFHKVKTFGKSFDFKRTYDGHTLHQMALKSKDDNSIRNIVDTLFKDTLCKKNAVDTTLNCLSDNIFYDCIDPNKDILVNYNHFNGEAQECMGPYLQQLKDEGRPDPFDRSEIETVRVNDLVERLLSVMYDTNTILPKSV